MSEKVELVKEVYGRNTYPRVVDIQFSELYNPVVADTVSQQVTVEAFFDLYNQLFFEIFLYSYKIRKHPLLLYLENIEYQFFLIIY